MTEINIARVYDDAAGREPADGWRVLVDRLWPRGESKEKFHYDLWAKGLAPSTELREWLHADPAERWDEFCRRYDSELGANPATKGFLAEAARHERVTLLYSSRDEEHNNAVTLARYMRSHMA